MSSKTYAKHVVMALTLATLTLSGCSTDSNRPTTQGQKPPARSDAVHTRDNSMAASIFNQYRQLPIASESHVNVSVFNGYVLLTGQVPSQQLKDGLQNIAEQTQGHTDIYNAVKVSVNTSHWQRMNDTWITTRVKSALNISENRVSVLTENGVVYLMGMVHSYEADDLAKRAANISGVTGVVKAFQIVD